MTKSTTRNEIRKPDKPYEGFPLFPHQTGRWAKKIRGKTHFFGRWGSKQGDAIIPVDDVNGSAAEAKERFDREWPFLSTVRTPPAATGSAFTVRDLCNQFLTSKKNRLESGELSVHSFAEYRRIAERIIEFFGRERTVDDIRPDDFEQFRAHLAKGRSVVTLKSAVNRARVVFKFASDNRLIDRPVDYGASFDRPSTKVMRQARNDAGERLIERDDLLKMLDKSDAVMRAVLLLGINAGFGNTDVSNLPQSAVDLDREWITFPRPKTGIQRRVPLWPETVEAMREAIRVRPAAVDPADEGACFLTARGTRYVRVQQSKTKEGHFVTINGIARRFELLIKAAGVDARKGIGFYTLRHCFQTHAEECRDAVAVSAIVGHADGSMSANYREKISDDRLTAATDAVRKWLFPDHKATPAKRTRKPSAKG